jgi:hypothetical protein
MMNRHRKQGVMPETTAVACDGCAPRVQEMPETETPALAVQRDSTITCPQCGTPTRARMPTDACLFFWECPACGALLKPNPGDCCVFCSWGDVPCPPVQAGRHGCE